MPDESSFDGSSQSQDFKASIHEVTPNEIADRTKSQLESDSNRVLRLKFEKPTYLDELSEASKTMMQKLGGSGEAAVHQLLPFVKEKFVDNREESRNPTELVAFALINDAGATSSEDDVARTLDALSSIKNAGENMYIHTEPVRDAQDQLCYTLARQASEIKANNPADPRLETIIKKLNEIRNAADTDNLLKEFAIRVPLTAAGDQKATDELGTIADQSVAKYQHRRFDLEKYAFIDGGAEAGNEYIDAETSQTHTAESLAAPAVVEAPSAEEVQEKIVDIREKLQEAVPEASLSDAEKMKRTILEGLRNPNTISSADSTYTSGLQYEVPDPERLWHYLKNEDYHQGSRIGPEIGELGGQPTIVFNKDSNTTRLQIPTNIDQNKQLHELFAPEFIDQLSKTVQDSISSRNRFIIDKTRQVPLLRRADDGTLSGVANLKNGVLEIEVQNMVRNVGKGINNSAELGVALKNALELHRILITELYKEQQIGDNLHGKSTEGMPNETVIIDPDWRKYSTPLAQAA